MSDNDSTEDVEFVALDNAITAAVESMSEQLEKELRGAWRAGYDYLHVYEPVQPLARQEIAGGLSLMNFTLPSHHRHPPRPDGTSYLHTYDIGSVPDTVIRATIRAASQEARHE
jgi:hypothetical protein